MTPSIPASVLECLTREPAVRRVVLFGSRARGDAGPRSDLDLAVEAPTMSRAEWSRLWADVQEADTLLGLDVVRLDEVSASVRERIEAEGRTLYCHDAHRTPTPA